MESELCGSWCGSMAHVLEAHRCSISVVFPWVMSMPHPAGLLSVAVVHSRIWKVYDTVCRHACWNCVVSIDGRPGSGPTFLLPSTVSGHLVLRPCMTVGWEQESCDQCFSHFPPRSSMSPARYHGIRSWNWARLGFSSLQGLGVPLCNSHVPWDAKD